MSTKISATIVADSLGPNGDRITSILVTFPRFILAELNTHRMLSKNSASSRAIPLNKVIKSVTNNPFIPIAWQKDHKGMQGNEYFQSENGDNTHKLTEAWLIARDNAVQQAQGLNNCGVTKQLCNRLLEPFMWHTVLITATEFSNFMALRCPRYLYDYEDEPLYFNSKKDWVNYYNNSQGYKENNKEFTKIENLTELEWLQINQGQAEIHMMALAEAMYDAMNESMPNQLKPGEWHIPYEDKINEMFTIDQLLLDVDGIPISVKIGSIMAARTSYTVVDTELSEWTAIKYCTKADELSNVQPIHASPFEHGSKCMSDDEYMRFVKGYANEGHDGLGFDDNQKGWCNNFKGFIQYRYLLENK